MRWRDLERDSHGWWWNLPVELTKTNRAHRVPLSPQALAIVEALRPLTGSTEWVLASRAEGKRLTWLSHSSARLRAWSELPHFTPHDLRRTAATWLGRSGVRPDTIDHLLNHADGRITRTYNRAGYDAEKRQAAILLGERVDAILAGEERSNVVRIARDAVKRRLTPCDTSPTLEGRMIRSFRHRGLERLWNKGDARGVRADLLDRVRVRTALDAAQDLRELAMPGWGLHQLQGKPERFAVSVNGPWRITFEWEDGDALRVDLEQYH